MIAITNNDYMQKIGKIYALGEIRSGVSVRTGNPWASREVVLSLYNKALTLESGEQVVLNMQGANVEDLERLKVDQVIQVYMRFNARVYDKTMRWYNNITANMSETVFMNLK